MTTPNAAKKKLRFKTIIISDVHLGVPECKAVQASHFLRHCLCEKLLLNGDIIDGWELRRGGKWTQEHTQFIRAVLRKMTKEKTETIYLRGNHDDNEYIHETPHGRYLVIHGDGFDHVVANHKWLAELGAVGYNTMLRLNRLYNHYRLWRGKQPFSFAKWVKAKVKGAVSHVGNYETQLQELARQRECQGIICGHIHSPANKQVGSVHYLNSGDWVESMTAVVENMDRTWEVITYEQFCERTNRTPKSLIPGLDIEDANDEDEAEPATSAPM